MGLKLLANDADDLKVLASAMQDAIIRVGDIRFDPASRSLTLQMSRFRHENAKPARVRTGLRADGVLAVRSQGLDRERPEAFAVLLDAQFSETDAPAGTLDLVFAGDGVLRLEVEGLDLTLADAGETRRTRSTPSHGT